MKNTSTDIGIMEKPPQPNPDEMAKQSLTRIKTDMKGGELKCNWLNCLES